MTETYAVVQPLGAAAVGEPVGLQGEPIIMIVKPDEHTIIPPSTRMP